MKQQANRLQLQTIPEVLRSGLDAPSATDPNLNAPHNPDPKPEKGSGEATAAGSAEGSAAGSGEALERSPIKRENKRDVEEFKAELEKQLQDQGVGLEAGSESESKKGSKQGSAEEEAIVESKKSPSQDTVAGSAAAGDPSQKPETQDSHDPNLNTEQNPESGTTAPTLLGLLSSFFSLLSECCLPTSQQDDPYNMQVDSNPAQLSGAASDAASEAVLEVPPVTKADPAQPAAAGDAPQKPENDSNSNAEHNPKPEKKSTEDTKPEDKANSRCCSSITPMMSRMLSSMARAGRGK